jgi:FkbM family methyltransferase
MAESTKARIRHATNALLHPLGLHLSRAERAFEMDGLVGRAAARGTNIGTWIDVGASDGSWSLRAQAHFPKACFLLFEPLAERQPGLESLRGRHGFDIVAAAAGAKSGSVDFAIDPDLDGSGIAVADSTKTRSVPMETIDRAIAARALPGPYGLKLDTHGYELEVLAGASHALEHASLLVIEAYNFTLRPGSLRFHELCAWLEQRGFRCCDLADPMRRRDGVLWQVDLAFVPSKSPLFKSDSYA